MPGSYSYYTQLNPTVQVTFYSLPHHHLHPLQHPCCASCLSSAASAETGSGRQRRREHVRSDLIVIVCWDTQPVGFKQGDIKTGIELIHIFPVIISITGCSGSDACYATVWCGSGCISVGNQSQSSAGLASSTIAYTETQIVDEDTFCRNFLFWQPSFTYWIETVPFVLPVLLTLVETIITMAAGNSVFIIECMGNTMRKEASTLLVLPPLIEADRLNAIGYTAGVFSKRPSIPKPVDWNCCSCYIRIRKTGYFHIMLICKQFIGG